MPFIFTAQTVFFFLMGIYGYFLAVKVWERWFSRKLTKFYLSDFKLLNNVRCELVSHLFTPYLKLKYNTVYFYIFIFQANINFQILLLTWLCWNFIIFERKLRITRLCAFVKYNGMLQYTTWFSNCHVLK